MPVPFSGAFFSGQGCSRPWASVAAAGWMRRRRAGRRCYVRRSHAIADVSQSIRDTDAHANPQVQADQGVEQLRQGHRHWRLRGDTQSQGRRAMGDRQDPDQGA